MATAALVGYGVYFLIAFGVRIAVQVLRTGSSGVKGLPSDAPPVEWLAGTLFVVGLLTGFAAAVLAADDVVEPVETLDTTAVHLVGVVLFVAGLLGTFGAQVAMGTAWRIGVDPQERTDLVTDGPFALVRNPIYSAMLPATLGLALMVPSAVALAGLLVLWLGLELQVRVVEEPYLRRVHGEGYVAYARRVGRFVPGLGRIA